LNPRPLDRAHGALRELQHADIGHRSPLPGMRGGPAGARRGRRGRRTSQMIRTAHERIGALFALAEAETHRGPGPLPTRYVELARRIGMRYNLRLASEYRDLYCRGCSTYWVEGRTVRTRLRAGHRVRTCLACGRPRRVETGARRISESAEEPGAPPRGRSEEPVLVGDEDEPYDGDEGEEE
jgi:ribonuclease P protein subunit RPR2